MPSFSRSILTFFLFFSTPLISTVLAAPASQLNNNTTRHHTWNNDNNNTTTNNTSQPQTCLTDPQAQSLATAYGLLISSYTPTLASTLLTRNFTDYSQSVNTLINSCPQGPAAEPLPLSAPTFTSLEEFKEGQGQQPAINFLQLNLWRGGCRSLTVRWMSDNTVNVTDLGPSATEGVRSVVGVIVMEVTTASTSTEVDGDGDGEGMVESGGVDGWKVHTVYSEFDAGSWLQNLQDADICHNPEKNLGAPEVVNAGAGAATPSGTAATAASPHAVTGLENGSMAATAAPMKRARMYV